MKKIIINEDKERKLLERVINESLTDYSSKVDEVVSFLDDNFFRASIPQRKGVKLVSQPIVLGKKNGQPDKDYRLDVNTQLFEVLQGQEEFKDMFDDKEERDKFLKQVINDWYYRNISKYGSLSKY